VKTLIVDDHVLIREALHGVLGELYDESVVVEAPDSRGAMRCIDEHPDLELVLLDLYLPDRSGFDVLCEIRDKCPAVSVVMLSVSSNRNDIARALELGAQGFIPKSAPREVMLSAFRLIFSGGVYVPPEMFGHSAPGTPYAATPAAGAALGLTQRQMEVLTLMMQGKSNKAICRTLDLAEPTVKNHVTAILRTLKVNNRTEAVVAATEALASTPRGDPVPRI